MAKVMAPNAAPYEPHYTQDLYVPSSADAEYIGREITLYGRPVFEGISSTQVRHMPMQSVVRTPDGQAVLHPNGQPDTLLV